MASITLYELPGCPYCAKVRSKLESLDLEFDVQEVPRAHPDRTEVKEVSGQTGVPVIIDRDHGIDGMAESDEIVSYLESTYGS